MYKPTEKELEELGFNPVHTKKGKLLCWQNEVRDNHHLKWIPEHDGYFWLDWVGDLNIETKEDLVKFISIIYQP